MIDKIDPQIVEADGRLYYACLKCGQLCDSRSDSLECARNDGALKALSQIGGF